MAYLSDRLPAYMVPASLHIVASMPLTANGKVDRHALVDQVRDDAEAAAHAYQEPRTWKERILTNLWQDLLGRAPIGVHENFFSLGGDSILVIQAIARARKQDINLNARQFFKTPTIAALARTSQEKPPLAFPSGPVSGPVTLTPIQRWFLQANLPHRHHFNQALMLRIKAPVNREALQGSLALIMEHHDMLRLRLDVTPDGIQARTVAPRECSVPLDWRDLGKHPHETHEREMATTAQQLHHCIDLERGPIWRAALFANIGGNIEDARLLLIVHHMAIDGVSWRILLEDLELAYLGLCHQEPVQLPQKTHLSHTWAERLSLYANDSTLAREFDFWFQTPDSSALPKDFEGSHESQMAATTGQHLNSLNRDRTTQLLQQVPAVFQTQVEDMLLTALALTLSEWSGHPVHQLSLEGHGREPLFDELDISRTIGWFTSVFPVTLNLEKVDTAQPIMALKAIKEHLRAIPHNGIGYGILRYLHPDSDIRARSRMRPNPEISFNYLGQTDQVLAGSSLFGSASEPVGETVNPIQARSHLLDINALVSDGSLHVNWSYGRALFRHETIVDLADRYANHLSNLIRACLESEGGRTPADFPLVTCSQPSLDRVWSHTGGFVEALPLFPAQAGMLFHTLLEHNDTPAEQANHPGQGQYFTQVSCRLEGEFHVRAFQDAWHILIQRHESLRTSFHWQAIETPLQLIHEAVTLPWNELDWRTVPEAEQADRLQRFLEEDRRNSFTLEQAPLMRCTLIHLNDDDSGSCYRFIWSHHHLLLDGWSLPILFEELFVIYRALATSTSWHLEPVPPLKDYAAWLVDREPQPAADYWRALLTDFDQANSLNLPRPTSSDNGYGETQLRLTAEDTRALLDFAEHQRLTPNTLALAAWALALSHFSGDRDVVFGTTVSGRPAELNHVEKMTGLFINTIPVRIDINHGEWIPWLIAIQEQQQKARQFAFRPLNQIQRDSQTEPSNALFDSILVFENYPVDKALDQGKAALDIQDVRLEVPTNFPLTVLVVPGDRFHLRLQYHQTFIHARNSETLLQRFQDLLIGFVEDQRTVPVDRTRLAEPEHARILSWNQAAQADLPSRDITRAHQWLEGHARRQPQAPALGLVNLDQSQTLSYERLNELANQVAHELLAHGFAPGDRVGVLAKPSAGLFAAFWGALKIGATYVPLDPRYPTGRLNHMIDHADLRLLLTDQPDLVIGARDLPKRPITMISNGFSDPALTEQPVHNPAIGFDPMIPAYVMFTSGSTGKPKGVVISHANLVSSTHARLTFYPRSPQAYLLLSSPSFDSSVAGIYWTAAGGGQLLVPTFEFQENLSAVIHLINHERVSHLLCIPALYRLLLEETRNDHLAGLDTVILAGEALPATLAVQHRQRLPNTALVNEYGPTEATVWCSGHHVDFTEREAIIPIGQPIAGSRLFLCDHTLQPMPLGSAGELCIAGDGLAAGYFQSPRQTALRFVPAAISETGGERWYRSGDLVYLDTKGDLHFLGRIDQQVKIRGYRIEPEEIAAILNGSPTIQEAVVDLRRTASGVPLLVAYVVLNQPAESNQTWQSDVQKYLETRLPEYMRPSTLVALRQIPRTPNGKVQRSALPDPRRRKDQIAAPHNTTQALLVAIWQDVLGIEAIGIDDHFFKLGGDSILNLQVVARAHQAGLRITPRHLLEYPTIAQLSLVAEAASPALSPTTVHLRPFELTPIQTWFLEGKRGNRNQFNQALLLRVPNHLQPELLTTALTTIQNHHDSLRLRLEAQGAEWFQRYAPIQQMDTIDVFDFSQHPAPETQYQETLTSLQTSLNLTSGPLMRMALFRLDEHDQEMGSRLFWAIHHFAVDGYSWRILLADLHHAYSQLEAGESISLPSKTTPYQVWSERQRARLDESWLNSELAFWQGYGRDSYRGLPLRSGVNKPVRATVGGAKTVDHALTEDVTTQWLDQAGNAFRTQPQDLLVVSLAGALARFSEGSDILFDLEHHGRDHDFEDVDVSRTVGWFTAIHPVWLHTSTEQVAEPNRGLLIKQVKEQLRLVTAHASGYGFIRYTHPDQEVRHALQQRFPAQLLFNYLGILDEQAAAKDRFARSADMAPGNYDPAGERDYPLEINAAVNAGQLRMTLSYEPNLLDESDATRLLDLFQEELERSIEFCLQPDQFSMTPSDVPLADLDQESLDQLLDVVPNLEDTYSLSPMQEGMLFDSLLNADSRTYFLQLNIAIQGNFQPELFRQAWQALIERHTSLRTSYHHRGLSTPIQVVHPVAELPWIHQDLSGHEAAEQQRLLDQLLLQDRSKGFDLSVAPLLRMAVFALGPQHWRLVMSHHHLLTDGWSLTIVFREVMALYRAMTQGTSIQFDAVRPFREYIRWYQSRDVDAARRFWKTSLTGFRQPNGLVHKSPAESSAVGEWFANRHLLLSEPLTRQLETTARTLGVTLNTMTEGAWAILLGQYAQTQDTLFGITVSGRPAQLTGIEDMVGLFINTLPLRIALEPEIQVADWLRDIQAIHGQLDDYSYAVLADIQSQSDLPAGTPLFESLLVFENYPMRAAIGDRDPDQMDFQFTILDSFEFATYPLTVVAIPGERFSLTLSYDTRCFDQSRIDRMLGHFRQILSELAKAPDQQLSHIDMLSPRERAHLLVDWNQKDAPLGTAFVHQRIEHQAALVPEAIAVRCGSQQLTYRELDQAANALAHQLIEIGIGPETIVALVMDRGLHCAVSLLAILKAGGAFLPLNPNHPSERARHILQQSGAAAVLLDRPYESWFKDVQPDNRLPVLPAKLPEPIPLHLQPPQVTVHDQSLAYVIFTSGSTGKPKGAMIHHRGMLNHVSAKISELGLTYADSVSQDAALTFDIVVWQYLAALVCGGMVQVYDDDIAQAPPRLLEQVAKDGVTVLEIVPSVLAVMLKEKDRLPSAPLDLSKLRWLLSSGETLSPDLAREWLAYCPHTQLVNMWGATECSDDVTHVSFAQTDDLGSDRLSIGTPIDNIQVYLLNDRLAPVPIGIPGQLFVAGTGVGRGYLHDPARTATAFIPNPHGQRPGNRLYRTGDLARFREDGHPEFLGRADFQVKVRGHRIECGEIEHRLQGLPEVREAVVLTRPNQVDELMLVGYVVPQVLSADDISSETVEERAQNQTEGWKSVWDSVYRELETADEGSPDQGRIWKSSYTDLAYADEEIAESIHDTVSRIRALKPRRILELGCGIGLILEKLVDECDLYVGTDLAEPVVDQLRTRFPDEAHQSKLYFLAGAADDFSQLPETQFDLVIINEVVQYFPSQDYLVRVIKGALSVLAPGGRVFLGGIRHYDLFRAFHGSVQSYRAVPNSSVNHLLQTVQRGMNREKELLVSPDFFYALPLKFNRIRNVGTLVKGGTHHNEFTKFRYDVLVSTASADASRDDEPPTPLDWYELGGTLDALASFLETHAPAHVSVQGIANARLLPERELTRLLFGRHKPASVAELRQQVAAFVQTARTSAAEPSEITALGQALGYETMIRFDSENEAGFLEAFFTKTDAASPQPPRFFPPISYLPALGPDRGDYTNRLLQEVSPQALSQRIKRALKATLPEYMVPTAVVVMESFPLTSNGKIDRRALPDSSSEDRSASAVYVPPRTTTEHFLAETWKELLGVDKVGIHDNFFELGGHSLLATRVMARIRKEEAVDVPLREVFQAPTIEDLAARLETLRLHRHAPQHEPIHPVRDRQHLPLSFAQQRLWFLDQLEDASATYNIPLSLRIEGPLALPILVATLTQITERHEVLRTAFPAIDGKPTQLIRPPQPLSIQLLDLSQLPAPEQQQEATRLTKNNALSPFDLGNGPLIRMSLVRLGENDHLFLLTMHHIISDGWSTGIIVDELATIYRAKLAGRPSPLAPLPLQYGDFAHWQKTWLSAEKLSDQLDYWKNHLAGAPSLMALPTDFPRPAVQTFRGSSRPIDIPRDITERIKDLSQSQSTTLFMTLITAFCLVLQRYSGQSQLVVGTGVANRTRRELESLVGFFVNTLALRFDLTGSPNFLELLDRVRTVCLQAYEHQDIPFEQVVETLQPERNLSYSPLFQVLFDLQNLPEGELHLPELKLSNVYQERVTAKFDLTFSLKETEQGLKGSIEYKTDLFRAETIDGFADHFRELLCQIVDHPSRPSHELPLIGTQQRAVLLRRGNQTERTYPQDQSLASLFEAIAAQHPHAIAATATSPSWLAGSAQGSADEGPYELTFEQLNQLANQVAHHLIDMGVGPEVLVGLCIDRSLEMLIGLLGILKSGAAYLPLDCNNPMDRLTYMIQDSGIGFLMTHSSVLDQLPAFELSFLNLLVLDEELDAVCQAPASNPAREDHPLQQAYVIYTSGSTGQPKGSLLTKRGMVNYLCWAAEYYQVDQGNGAPVHATIGFDATMTGLWTPLLAAKPVHLLSNTNEVEALAAALDEDKEPFGLIKITPAHLDLLDQLIETPQPATNTMVIGGDALTQAQLASWFARAPQVSYINEYGPTEAVVGCCIYRAKASQRDPDQTHQSSAVPIGTAIANAQMYLLDHLLEPVPRPLIGELYIGGHGLARGYLQRPALTAERFIPNPFSDLTGERLYRTGDLAMTDIDGQLVYQGRADQQMSIRGFRIEPQEIETAIRAHKGVHDALVTRQADHRGEQRLVAYLVPDRETAATVFREKQLRQQGKLNQQNAFQLPNGMLIAQQNKAESEYLYKEIFLDKTYLKNGLTFGQDDVIVDVGANIGFTMLFLQQFIPNMRYVGFEPIPPTYSLLEINAALCGVDCRLFNDGVSDQPGSVTFVHYPNASVMSGRYADDQEDREVMKTSLLTRHDLDQGSAANAELSGADVDELVAQRLEKELIACSLVTLSDVFAREQIDHVDLLKVDAEKSELNVLQGISEEDWPKIRQVALEVHDSEGRQATIQHLLIEKGFQILTEQDPILIDTQIFNIYATRPQLAKPQATPSPRPRQGWFSGERLIHDLEHTLKKRLPGYMIPNAYDLLSNLPLNENGKVAVDQLPPIDFQEAQTSKPYAPPETKIEKIMVDIWSKLLGVDGIGIHTNFFDIGGDSILSIQVIARARKAGLLVTTAQIFDHQTIAELSPVIKSLREVTIDAEQGAVHGTFKLLPSQQHFFEQAIPERHHYNQAVMFTVPADLDSKAMAHAVMDVVAHHDALRLRFTHDGTNWRARHEEKVEASPFCVRDLGELPHHDRGPAIEAEAATWQEELDLEHGPLMRVVWMQLGPDPGRLLIIVHHLVVDGVSWRILLEDLVRAYQGRRLGQPPALPPKTTSLQSWSRRLHQHASEMMSELEFWRESRADARLPIDKLNSIGQTNASGQLNPAGNTIATTETVTVALDEDPTHLLIREVPRIFHTSAQAVMVTALARVLKEWLSESQAEPTVITIDLEGHGREALFEEVDLSRTLGWFTSIYPATFQLIGDQADHHLKSVKETLQTMPNHGIGYGILRYLHPDPSVRQACNTVPSAQVLFNYLGQTDAPEHEAETVLFEPCEERPGPMMGKDVPRSHLLEVTALVSDGSLQIRWDYGRHLHHKATVQRLAASFLKQIQLLIEHCLTGDAHGFTPSNFPLAYIDQPGLDLLLNRCKAQGSEPLDMYRLAPIQEGMLYHTQLESSASPYFNQVSCRLVGPLNLSAFRRAWSMAVDRHDGLRTSFHWQGLVTPVQVIHPSIENLPWQELDWQDLDPNEQDNRFQELIHHDRHQPFDMSQAPLMRWHIVRRGPTDCGFIWSFHHLLLDGWSSALLLKEVFAFYDHIDTGIERKLLDRPRSYRDYIQWLAAQNPQSAEAYWRKTLADFPSVTGLPQERGFAQSEPTTQASHQNLELRLSPEQSESLRVLAKAHRLTLNTLFQGIWALLLSRYQAQSDVVFGVTVSGRPPELDGVDSVIGLFINTLPLRIAVDEDRVLLTWLKAIQQQQVNQEPFAQTQLVDIRRYAGLPPEQPLFESIVVFENYPVDESLSKEDQTDLEVRDITSFEHNHFPLTLVVIPSSSITLQLSFRTDRFDAPPMQTLLQQVATLATNIVSFIDQPLHQCSLITAAERDRLIHEVNQTNTRYPATSVHRYFEEQATQNPQAAALVWGLALQHISYADLNERANRLAHHLMALGVRHEMPVGVCLQRSPDLIIALLAILKCGGHYVPLEPDYPRERLAFMLQDTGLSILISDQHTIESLPANDLRFVQLILVDEESAEIADQPESNPTLAHDPDQLAYVMYTSGSTGKPKGVQITHRGIMRLLFGVDYIQLNQATVMLHLAPISFDASTLEVWGPLLHGGRCVLFPEHRISMEQVAKVLVEAKVNTLWLTASLFNLVIDESPECLRGVQQLLAGGEALSPPHVARALEALPTTTLINGYGPTESTTFTCCYPIPANLQPLQAAIPIGTPIGHTRVYLLDSQLRPVAPGMQGELYIAGDGLARGYLNRAAATASLFIPNPLAGEGLIPAGDRLYRSGDWARFTEDGSFTFLGRRDHQVKIRGFRIEINEIEAVLTEYPMVRIAAVVAHPEPNGDKRLVGYLEPWPTSDDANDDHRQETVDLDELQQYLAERLPGYMVPSQFVTLKRLPLSPNGKIDRSALPHPERIDRQDRYQPPATPTEVNIGSIWSRLLGIEQIDNRDRFLDLGGHSLLITQLIARLQRTFGVSLSLTFLFENPTLEDLAHRVDSLQKLLPADDEPFEELDPEEEELEL